MTHDSVPSNTAKAMEIWLRTWLSDKHDCGTRIAMRSRDSSCLACQIYSHLDNESWKVADRVR